MRFKRRSLQALFSFSLVLFTPSCISAAEENTSAATASSGLTLKKGQVLSVVMPANNPDGETARKDYYDQAFTLAGQYGLKRETMLKIDDIIISDYKPGAAIFYSYPDAASEKSLGDDPTWPAIKALRPAAWEELKIFTATVGEDLNLQFDPAKSYTLVIAWLNPDNPDDYQNYLKGIEGAVAEAGGRFVYKMYDPQFESHASGPEAPGQLTFVEWDTLGGFAQARNNPEYQAASKRYFQSGVSKVEFYRLSVPSR